EHRLQELREQLDTARRSATDAGTAEQIDRAEHQLDQALEELAELAQGLHPRILTEAGLPGALEFLRERSTVPVEVSIATDGLTPQVEATAYFVCSEALANVGKYASASRATVSVKESGGRVVIEVEDDGVGGADLSRGSGLRGLADRVEALGGTIRLDSPPGRGTRLLAEIPSPEVAL